MKEPSKIIPCPMPLGNKHFIDITGKTFNRLTVLRFVGKLIWRERAIYMWECVCLCGKHVTLRGYTFTSGVVKSCGCWKSEVTSKLFRTHGMTGKGEYNNWRAIKGRCLDQNNVGWENYGGGGITICERWLGDNGFQNFLADMGPKPTPKHEVDRYPNPNGNYEPGNCRWATRSENCLNRKSNHLIEFNGERLSVTVLAKKHGVKIQCLLQRLRRGWSVERALTERVLKIGENLRGGLTRPPRCKKIFSPPVPAAYGKIIQQVLPL